MSSKYLPIIVAASAYFYTKSILKFNATGIGASNPPLTYCQAYPQQPGCGGGTLPVGAPCLITADCKSGLVCNATTKTCST